MSTNCNKTINKAQYKSAGWEGRGFGRKYIATYLCACGNERRMIVSGRRGKNPDIGVGGFVCGAYIA